MDRGHEGNFLGLEFCPQIFRLETLRLDWLGLPNVRTTHATEGHEPGFF